MPRVIRAFERLGFTVVRKGNHVSMSRDASAGAKNHLTIPGHRNIKKATLRSICTQAEIARDDFLAAYNES